LKFEHLQTIFRGLDPWKNRETEIWP